MISTMLDQTAIEPSSVASPIITEEAAPHDIEIFYKFITFIRLDFMLTVMPVPNSEKGRQEWWRFAAFLHTPTR